MADIDTINLLCFLSYKIFIFGSGKKITKTLKKVTTLTLNDPTSLTRYEINLPLLILASTDIELICDICTELSWIS